MQAKGEAVEAGRGALFLVVVWAFILVSVWVGVLLLMVSRGLYSGS